MRIFQTPPLANMKDHHTASAGDSSGTAALSRFKGGKGLPLHPTEWMHLKTGANFARKYIIFA